MESPTSYEGDDFEKKVAETLLSNGWQVKMHPTVPSGTGISEVDIIAEKSGKMLAMECKTGLGTFVDIFNLSSAKAADKYVVAMDWASERTKMEAQRKGISLIRPESLHEAIESVESKRVHAFSRLWTEFMFHTYQGERYFRVLKPAEALSISDKVALKKNEKP